MCHFHQKRIIQRYITLHPKLEASQELKKIMTRLKYSDENRFTKALDIWYIKYKSFLDEITIHPDSQKKSSYTHKKLVAAYRSIRNNLPYLFTYKIIKIKSFKYNKFNWGWSIFSIENINKIHRVWVKFEVKDCWWLLS